MKLRVLVAYSLGSVGVQTTNDYLRAFTDHLDAEVEFLHVTDSAICHIDIEAYDTIINNYCARLNQECYVSESYRRALKAFPGTKVLIVQDEYERTDKIKEAIREFAFDVVLTCVPRESVHLVYPQSEFPGVHFEPVLTGYVPEHLTHRGTSIPALRERPIAIGYRGRDIGARYGRLAFEKFEIGRRMRALCEERGIRHDIAVDEASRIYGSAWLSFIRSCRAMLGTESGSNVFDFDGSIEAQFESMTSARGGRRPSYEEFLPLVADRETISMGQISPRIFECAACLTPMILFCGSYSGAIEPDRHYIALEKDFSNVDDVFRRLEDLPELERMATRAHQDLVQSGRFRYRAFVKQLEGLIKSRHRTRRRRAARADGAQIERADLSERDALLLSRPTPLLQDRSVLLLQQRKLLLLRLRDELAEVEQMRDRTIQAYRHGMGEIEALVASAEEPKVTAALNRAREQLSRIEAGARHRALPDDVERQIATIRDRAAGIYRELAELADAYRPLAQEALELGQRREAERLLNEKREQLSRLRAELATMEERRAATVQAYAEGMLEMARLVAIEPIESSDGDEETRAKLRRLYERLRRPTAPEERDFPDDLDEQIAVARTRIAAIYSELEELSGEYAAFAAGVVEFAQRREAGRILSEKREQLSRFLDELADVEANRSQSVRAYGEGLQELERAVVAEGGAAPSAGMQAETLANLRRLRDRLHAPMAGQGDELPDDLDAQIAAVRARLTAAYSELRDWAEHYAAIAQAASEIAQRREAERLANQRQKPVQAAE